jgi:polyisoprenoid-binding protein YceI
MKSKILYVASLMLVFGLTACGGGDTNAEEGTNDICVYSYDEGTTEFTWTAYKTTGKIGVPGTFDEIIMDAESSEDPMEVIKSMKFTMVTSSTNTQNEERDAKIVENFFNRLNTKEIYGKVVSINEKEGKATVSLSWHGVTYDVQGDYSLSEDNKFSFDASIDVKWWNGMAGIDQLNSVCEDLHTGNDGVSKLWSEVGVSFTTKIQSDCE